MTNCLLEQYKQNYLQKIIQEADKNNTWTQKIQNLAEQKPRSWKTKNILKHQQVTTATRNGSRPAERTSNILKNTIQNTDSLIIQQTSLEQFKKLNEGKPNDKNGPLQNKIKEIHDADSMNHLQEILTREIGEQVKANATMHLLGFSQEKIDCYNIEEQYTAILLRLKKRELEYERNSDQDEDPRQKQVPEGREIDGEKRRAVYNIPSPDKFKKVVKQFDSGHYSRDQEQQSLMEVEDAFENVQS